MNDSALMKIGLSVYLCASSARTTIAAAEPSLTPEQSMIPSGSATNGEHRICSIGTSLRNWALGFLAPFAWFLYAIRDRTSLPVSLSSPYLSKYAGASIENWAGAVIAGWVPSLGGGV